MKFQAKNYSSRSELEKDISRFDLSDPSIHSIEGTEEELKRLSLSYRTKVFGIFCTEKNKKIENVTAPPKPNRGEIFESTINGNKVKNK